MPRLGHFLLCARPAADEYPRSADGLAQLSEYCAVVLISSDLYFAAMSSILNKFGQSYSRIVGISPTGWNNSPKPHETYVVKKQGFVTIYGLPYRYDHVAISTR